MSSDGFVPLDWEELPDVEMQKKALELFENMNKRRTTRHFSSRHVPKELIETAIMCGSTAPSGAHLQPWTFVAVSNQELKAKCEMLQKQKRRKPTLNACLRLGKKSWSH